MFQMIHDGHLFNISIASILAGYDLIGYYCDMSGELVQVSRNSLYGQIMIDNIRSVARQI